MSSIAQHCPSLIHLNLNYTAATPSALSKILSSCLQLEVLKIAGVPKMVRFLDRLSNRIYVAYRISLLDTCIPRKLGDTDYPGRCASWLEIEEPQAQIDNNSQPSA